MAKVSYPVERLIPQGNVIRCDPCVDDLVTWWPSLQAGLDHQDEAHGSGPSTLWMMNVV